MVLLIALGKAVDVRISVACSGIDAIKAVGAGHPNFTVRILDKSHDVLRREIGILPELLSLGVVAQEIVVVSADPYPAVAALQQIDGRRPLVLIARIQRCDSIFGRVDKIKPVGVRRSQHLARVEPDDFGDIAVVHTVAGNMMAERQVGIIHIDAVARGAGPDIAVAVLGCGAYRRTHAGEIHSIAVSITMRHIKAGVCAYPDTAVTVGRQMVNQHICRREFDAFQSSGDGVVAIQAVVACTDPHHSLRIGAEGGDELIAERAEKLTVVIEDGVFVVGQQ